MSVFKGYLRGLIRLLKQIRTALNENDIGSELKENEKNIKIA